MPRSLVRRLTVRNRAPVPFTRRNRLALPFVRYNDLESQMQAMGAVGVLFAMVDKLAVGTAGVEWHLYRKARSGRKEDRTEVLSHPALNVLNSPNRFTTRQELIEAGQQHHELTGETWLIVGRNPKVPALPLELWNVRPDRMKPVPDPRDFIVGYVYTSPDGEQIPLPVEDVVFMRRPNPLDEFRGMGAVGSVLAHIEGERYAAEWNRNFFHNGAQPGGVIEVEKRLSEPEFREMVDRWREQHQGVANAHRVALLENGAKYVNTKMSQKDMDFTALSQLSGEKVREALGFPKPMLGSVDDVNRANAEAGEYVFGAWMIKPRLERWKQALNNDFLPLFGDMGKDLEFDYDSPVPADRAADNAELTAHVDAAIKMITAGFDPAEVLEWLELPDLSFTKPEPPPPPSPPPGGGGPNPPDDDPPDGPGTPGEPSDLVRLARWLGEAPADQFERRASAVRLVLGGGGGREHRAGHGGRCRCGEDDSDDPWRARAAADDPKGPPVPPLPAVPDGVRPELPEGAQVTDLEPVQESWEAALAALLTRWADVVEQWKVFILDAIAQRIAGGDVLGLTGIGLPDIVGPSATVQEAMMSLGREAADKVVAEAAEQDIEDINAMGPGLFTTAVIAQACVVLLARELTHSAVLETLRIYRPGVTPDAVREHVSGHLDALTDARPKMVLGGLLTQAQHDGRCRTIAGGPEAALYADEVLDKNTCKPCRDVNRKWIGNAGDALVLATYPVQGYVGCLGRQRCRGQVVAVWRGGSDWTKWVELPEQRRGQ